MPIQNNMPFSAPLDFQAFAKQGMAGIAGFTNPQDRQQQEYITNQTMWCYLTQILDIYCSVFEWENLPRGCDARQLEYWLMTNGFVGFVYDELLATAQPRQAPLGYGIMRLACNGQLDMYQLPEDVAAYSVAADANYLPLTRDNCVIIFNDQLRVSPMPTIYMHAWRMTNIQRSLDSNIAQQKFATLIRGSHEQMRQIKEMMGATYAGVPYQFVDKDFQTEMQQIPIAPEDRISSLTSALDNEWSETKTFAGIESSRQKNERVFSTEASANLAGTDAFRFTRSVPRMKAADEINEMLDRNGYFEGTNDDGTPRLPVEVHFREGAYVQSDGDPDNNDPDGGGPMEGDDAIRGRSNNGPA